MITLVTVAAVFVAIVWLGQRSFIYFPSSHVPPPASLGLPQAEPVTFTTEDGLELDAWFVPAGRPSADRTVVVFNGNAGNRSHRALLAALFAGHGYSTLLVDYRGYGGNPGLPSERGLYRDGRAALRYLAGRGDVNPARIVYFGESLGAGVAVALAAEHPPAAIILRSPASSLVSIGERHYPFLPVRLLLRDRYPSIDLIGKVTCPVLVIAGDADRIVPPDDSRLLFEAAREPKQFVVIKGADHNDESLASGPEVMSAIRRFLQ